MPIIIIAICIYLAYASEIEVDCKKMALDKGMSITQAKELCE